MGFSLIKSLPLSIGVMLCLLLAMPPLIQAQERTSSIVKKEAISAFRAKEYGRAAGLFQELFGQTNNPNLLYNIGLCFYRDGNSAKAIESLTKFTQRVPSSRMFAKAKGMIDELKQNLTDDYINVIVKSDPPDANLFLNERSGGKIGTTPHTLKLLPGSYVLLVDKAGYEVLQRPIVVSKDGSREVFFQLYPTSQMGAIKFMISERDADVMVDKRRIGRSPIREELRLPNGEHEVLVMKPGYATWRQKVNVKAGKSEVVQVDLLSDRVLSPMATSTGQQKVWPYVTMGTGLLFAGGAAVLGAQAQSLHDKLESRAAQGVLVHPSDKATGNTWVMWTNVLSAVGAVALTGGATWWYLSDDSGDETSAQWTPDTQPTDIRSSVYGESQ